MADEWLPIEGAPKNKPILVGGWVGKKWLTTVYEISNEHWREDFDFVEDEPTHWMPCPRPPPADLLPVGRVKHAR